MLYSEIQLIITDLTLVAAIIKNYKINFMAVDSLILLID